MSEQESILAPLADLLAGKIAAMHEVEKAKEKLEEQGVHSETVCILACCSQLLGSMPKLLNTLTHLSDHHLMIGPGETALVLLQEAQKALSFVRDVESKYEVNLHITDVSLLEMAELIQTYEADLGRVKAERAKNPERVLDYVEMTDAEIARCKGYTKSRAKEKNETESEENDA